VGQIQKKGLTFKFNFVFILKQMTGYVEDAWHGSKLDQDSIFSSLFKCSIQIILEIFLVWIFLFLFLLNL